MLCPMMWCEWQCSELVASDGSQILPEDNLVTQYAALVEHLTEDHNAVVGGKE